MARLREFALFLLVLLVPLVALIFGCAAGIELFARLSIHEETWVLLGSPPSKVERIVDASLDHIIVRATDGKLYERYYDSPYDQADWKVVSEISLDEYQVEHGLGITPSYSNPNDVIQYIEADYESRYSMEAAYVLLKDGTIRKWGGFYGVFSAWTGLCILSSVIAGVFAFGIGFLLVSPILIKRRKAWLNL